MKYSISGGWSRFCMVSAFALALSLPLGAEELPDIDTVEGCIEASRSSVYGTPAFLTKNQENAVKHLNFRTALARAVQHSPELRAARSRYEQSKWDTKLAETGHNPTLDFNAQFDYGWKICKDPLSAYNYSGALVLQQAICTFGKLHYATVAAKLSEELAKEEFRKVYEGELHDVAADYIRCLMADETVKISRQQLELREASLKDAEALYNAGSTARFDVLRVQTAVSTVRQEVIVAENNRDIARVSLCNRLGFPIDTQLELESIPIEQVLPADLFDKIDLDESYESALLCRPELRMLDWSKQIAEASLNGADVSNNPNLALQSSFGHSRDVSNTTGTIWMASVVLNIPLLDGGEREAKMGKLRELINELDCSLDGARRNILLDVKSCYLALKSNIESIEVAKDTLEQAEEADRVARVRYNAGLSTSTELLDAHTSLGVAQLALVNARFSYFNTLVNWVKAISGNYPVTPPDLIDVQMLKNKPIDWYDLRKSELESSIDYDLVEEPCTDDLYKSSKQLWEREQQKERAEREKSAAVTESQAQQDSEAEQ